MPSQGADRASATRLRAAAIERRAQLDDDSALVLYRAARAADPDYFPAQYEYIGLMRDRFRGADLRREFASDHAAPALHECLMAAVQLAVYVDAPIARLHSLEATHGPSPCTDEFLLVVGHDATGRGARAMRDSPGLRDTWVSVAGALGDLGRWQEADRIFHLGEAAVDDPIAKVSLAMFQIDQHLLGRDTAGAFALSRSLSSALRRDGRPGLLAEYLSVLCSNLQPWPWSTPESRSTACRQFNALVHAHRAWFTEWVMTRWRAKVLIESGELAAAGPILARLVELADSAGSPALRLIAYTERGRALSKTGHLALALRDLRHAAALEPAAEEPYYAAEAYHNLAHTHEGGGHFAEAATAADSFVTIADRMSASAQRVMSRHDAGMIRWEAGWHAAAVQDFDAMVRLIDQRQDNHYYAGEYFERVGNLGRALEYYRAGARKYHQASNLAALARVYEALGLRDSAEAVAREHDANTHVWEILDRPLLPDILARRGRVDEAVSMADGWAHHQVTTGNIQGAAIAHLHLAELLLLDRHPGRALAAARTADSLCGLLRLTVEVIEARTLEGRALFDGGMRSPGLDALRSAVRLANAHPSTGVLLSTNLALGHALETSGRSPEALAAYDRAGSAVERMTTGLDEDVDRTGFKSLHLAPFDGALRILLKAAASAKDAEAALIWSGRRKAAAFALVGEPGTRALRHLPVAALRGRLGTDEALIDFTALDSSVAAIVVRRQSITTIPLSVSLSQLTAWIDALRRPLVATAGGRIDLAHAPFNAAIAESLFRALVAPLAGALRGVNRLAISPDGALWYVPFATLVTAQRPNSGADRGRPSYLLERYEMRLLPSAEFLTSAGDAGILSAGFGVEALTYTVPGGTEELAAIRAAVGANRALIREDTAATEHSALSATAEVLHVAAHGVVNDRDPLASHLRLAPDGRDDGLLHVSEVAAHRLAPRLVVLTACEAVNGKLYAGEGLVGLARAFLMGGARQVVASEWPVDASAAELTGLFYRALVTGKSPSAALRAAQLALLQKPGTAHPLHWAGFVVFDGGARR